MPTGGISTIDKKSIFFGYRETLISSYKIYNIISIYLIILKLILNLYSRFAIKYKKKKITFTELFFNNLKPVKFSEEILLNNNIYYKN